MLSTQSGGGGGHVGYIDRLLRTCRLKESTCQCASLKVSRLLKGCIPFISRVRDPYGKCAGHKNKEGKSEDP